MKKDYLFISLKCIVIALVLGIFFSAAWAGELRIQSFNGNGVLTWTNSISNATYRVEWAASLAGPWKNLTTLTNLGSIIATNSSVTVSVPMFYRVVWTDPPAPLGNWLFNGYNATGSLIVTGLVNVSPTTVGSFSGTWSFGAFHAPVDCGCNCWNGDLIASLYGTEFSMFLGGSGCPVEGAYWLNGTLQGDMYTGTWFCEGFVLTPIGLFTAQRQPQ